MTDQGTPISLSRRQRLVLAAMIACGVLVGGGVTWFGLRIFARQAEVEGMYQQHRERLSALLDGPLDARLGIRRGMSPQEVSAHMRRLGFAATIEDGPVEVQPAPAAGPPRSVSLYTFEFAVGGWPEESIGEYYWVFFYDDGARFIDRSLHRTARPTVRERIELDE